MRACRLFLAGMVLAVASSNANAAILTFDDIPGGSVPGTYGDMPTYQGFDFSFTLDWLDLSATSPWAFGAHSGDFGILNNNGGVGVTVELGGGEFTFDGIWAKAWATAPESGGPDFVFGVLEGYNNGNLVWSVATALNGSYKYFGAQAGLIDELHLGFGNHFLADDLALNEPVGEVPEPASLTLLSLGAIGLAGAARRRRQAV